jgi:hypothetical protein
MTASRPDNEAIFHAARDIPDPDRRREYVHRACGGDETRVALVEALLAAADAPDSLLDCPAVELLAGNDTQPAPAAPEDDVDGDLFAPSDSPGSLGRLGHYDILEVIGRGGMGTVLRAFDDKLHRVVAIKVMAAPLAADAAARRRFTREAQAQAAVSHDHVVTIHAVEGDGSPPYLVMQYVAGLSLEQRLDRDGPLALPEILRIAMQTASGLAAAHAQGLVHRDIKPANILLENGVERVRITDFGLAGAGDDASLSRSGVAAGTPMFMSPEQARGGPLDHRSDLFSLGSVLYTMCTGRPPFRAATSMAVLKRVCEETPTPIRETNPEIPDWLVAVVEKLHAKDPASRFQSAAEVANVLARQLAHVQHPSVIPLPAAARLPEDPAAPARRKRWAVAAAVLVAIVAALGATEATGITNVRATIVRVFIPDGTLIALTDDPDVKVTVEGDGGLVITGAGLEEIRLRPGGYRLRATKDGKPVALDRDLVTIARGDKQVVRVRLEAVGPAAAAPQAEPGAFVILGGKGVAERRFDTLAEAVSSVTGGDTIEVRGNGPFVIDHLAFNYALTIRAASGARPVFTSDPRREPPRRFLLVAPRALRLEGLEFRSTYSNDLRLLYTLGPLRVANCRFQIPDRSALCIESDHSCMVRNCELVSGGGAALAIRCDSDAPSEVANSIVVGHINLDEFDLTRGTTVQFRGNTFVSPYRNTFRHTLQPMDMPPDQIRSLSGKRLHVTLTENLLASTNGLYVLVQEKAFQPRFDADGLEAWLPRRVEWSDQRNTYRPVKSYIAARIAGREDDPGLSLPLSRGKDFADWNRFWGLKDTGSSEGDIRFLGGDLHAKALADAAKLTPEDFRLRPDSAGYRAGKDKMDVGADVDLVGPGAAYERWKKTPAYQQWLKDWGQLKR